MSLMQLLAVGRTLKGIRDESHRYRDISGKNLLPKFGSPRAQGVFKPVAQIAATRARPIALVEGTFAEGVSTEPEQAPKPAEQAHARTELKSSSLAAFIHGQRGKWFLAKNQSSTGGASSRPAAGARSNVIQDELSLDNVRVVRNDLSDADLEVVPALGRGPMGREEPTWVTAPKREMGLSVWSRATAKLIGALHL